MLARKLSFSATRHLRKQPEGVTRKEKPRTPSPSNTSHDSSEHDVDRDRGLSDASPLKGCLLKKNSSKFGREWAKRWMEVDDVLGCLLYYRTVNDQV